MVITYKISSSVIEVSPGFLMETRTILVGITLCFTEIQEGTSFLAMTLLFSLMLSQCQ